MARKVPIRTRKNRLPREARTRLLFDETDTNNGQFFRCWNCGFICHDKRDILGGPRSGHAVEHIDFTIQSGGIIPGVADSAKSMLIDMQNKYVTPQLDSAGNAKTVVHSYRTTGGGCPLCHSINYKGEYP